MSKKTLSLCMIVKNEEEFLRRCLESVKKLANEIIIVDTGSTDSTIKVAEEFDAKIYNFEWKGDFATARNFSIKHALSDYILILDADEYLDENYDVLKQNLTSDKDYYIVNIKNYLDHQVVDHQAIRVFKNHKGFFYKGKIHEHINVDDFPSLTQGTADIWIHHTGYQSSLYYRRNKHDRNMKLLLEEVQKNPTGYNYFNLGNQYKSNSEFDKAINAYKQAFYLSKDRVYLSYLLDQMGKCLLYLNRYEEGIELISSSIEGFPTYTNLYFTLGELYESLGYLKDAKLYYTKCLELGEVKDQQTMEGIGGYLAHFNLMRVYESEGDLPEALEQCLKSLQQNRSYLPSLLYLLKLLAKGNIPLNEMNKFLDNTLPIRNQNDLNNLIISLFLTRSSLLLHYIEKYNLQVEKAIEVIGLQYGNREKAALKEWGKVEPITFELAEDLFVLSAKNNNINLLSLVKNHFAENDHVTLESIVNKSEDLVLTQSLHDFLMKVIPKAGLLGDYDTVEYLINLLANNPKEQSIILKGLLEIGLKDFVIEYISNNLTSGEVPESYLEILGDLYIRNGMLADAVSIYNKLIRINPKYSYFEKLYNVYMRVKDTQFMETIKEKMKIQFPLAKWLK